MTPRRSRFRVMRSNYDKPHRCPGWSGPAMKHSDGDCPGGSLAALGYGSGRWDHWKIWRCPECGVHILPFVLRLADPTHWLGILQWRIGMGRRFGWHALFKR